MIERKIHPVPMAAATMIAVCVAFFMHYTYDVHIVEALAWCFLGVLVGTLWHWFGGSEEA
jgi:hypothetical protein